MSRSNLFPTFNRLQQQFQREARQTELGRLQQQLEQLRSRRNITPQELQQLERILQQATRQPGGLGNMLGRTTAGRLVQQIDRYGRSSLKDLLLGTIFRSLGPMGGILESMIRPQGRAVAPTMRHELDLLTNLLKSFGGGAASPSASSGGSTGGSRTGGGAIPIRPPGGGLPPGQPPAGRGGGAGGQGGGPSGPRSPGGGGRPGRGPRDPSVDAAMQLLEGLGFTVSPPDASRTSPPRTRTGTAGPGTVRVQVEGRPWNLRETDPLLTGAMLRVQSSNVHSIGYIWNGRYPTKGTLKVRFLAKQKNAPASGKGALYYYYDVHPQMFRAFQAAASKGKWVWDNLRIRGTVAGHQHRYALAALDSTGYVPRQATQAGEAEWYVPRIVTGKDGQTYESTLGAQLVRRLSGGGAGGGSGAPNRGTPNRGSPNRGTPNRGR